MSVLGHGSGIRGGEADPHCLEGDASADQTLQSSQLGVILLSDLPVDLDGLSAHNLFAGCCSLLC